MTECNKIYSSQLQPKRKPYKKIDTILFNKRWFLKLIKTPNNQGLLDHYKLEDLLSHLVVSLTRLVKR